MRSCIIVINLLCYINNCYLSFKQFNIFITCLTHFGHCKLFICYCTFLNHVILNYVNCIPIFCICAAGVSGRAVSVETE